MENRTPRFSEFQRLSQWWVWLPTLLGAGVTGWVFFQQVVLGRPCGSRPAPDGVLWAAFLFASVAMPLFLAACRLRTEVREDALFVRFSPLKTREIRYDSIRSCQATTYSPLGDFGGWGIRWGGPRRGWAYTMSGREGVQLELADGKRLLVGSRRAEDLARAILEQMRA